MSDDFGPIEREQLAKLFERALELPAEARAEFVDRVSGTDPALRAELGSLLASHAAAPNFLERLGERLIPEALASLSDVGLAAGQAVGHYRIVERVTGGGMGIVYQARDTALDRPVALKFLPVPTGADAGARARLRAEAKAASALDHPNIGVVYEIGETESSPANPEAGRPFVAMAWYEGETLGHKIARGPLPVRQAVDYTMQLLDGLSRAHEAGIVHRDIKPANLIVTGRDVLKIVDFGVAMVAGAEAAWIGGQPGTVGYMSPEQVAGGPVDHRTDLWSAGVVLHEMLAGTRPFRAGTVEVAVGAIRGDEPPALETLRPEVPVPLARLVRRCLTKDPELRYPSAEAVLTELRAIAAAPAAADSRPSLVVLPFLNISPNPDDEYLSDGLTEEVIADLARIRSLRVISRTTAMRFKRSDKSVRSIAHELGVRYALEGSVRKSGSGLRITARFIDAQRDAQLWARKFDGDVTDLFGIQEQVARGIVKALRLRLSPAETGRLSERPIPDPRAYECYLRARFDAWRFSREGLERARRYIEAALDIVGDNELLYSTLGHITAMHVEAGIDREATAIIRVRELADRVFELNEESARGHWLRAFVAFQEGDLSAAIQAAERSLVLAPDDADTLILLGYLNALAGRDADAEALVRRLTEVDPLTPLAHAVRGFLAIMQGRFTDAVLAYRRAQELDPESPLVGLCLGWSLAYARRPAEAILALEAAAARFPGTVFASWGRSLASSLRGEPARALEAITPEFIAAGRNSEMFARELAHCYALAGETDRAVEWVERQVGLGMRNRRFLAEHDWFLDGLRGEPKFQEVLVAIPAPGG